MSNILITGSGRGIGRAAALELSRRGHRVIATARNPGQLADMSVDMRLQMDVTDSHSVDQAVRAAGPIGEAARRVLAARRSAPDDVPFRLAPVTWCEALAGRIATGGEETRRALQHIDLTEAQSRRRLR